MIPVLEDSILRKTNFVAFVEDVIHKVKNVMSE